MQQTRILSLALGVHSPSAHYTTCRSDCCPLSDPRRQRSSPAQPSSHSRGDLRSWRPSLSWRLTHFWHCRDPCGHRTLAVRRSLSDGLTLGAHLTVVAHSSTCLFSLSSVPSLAPIVLLRSTSSNRVLSPPSAAHCFYGPCRRLAGSGSHRCHQL